MRRADRLLGQGLDPGWLVRATQRVQKLPSG